MKASLCTDMIVHIHCHSTSHMGGSQTFGSGHGVMMLHYRHLFLKTSEKSYQNLFSCVWAVSFSLHFFFLSSPFIYPLNFDRD